MLDAVETNSEISENLRRITERVQAAARRAGREPEAVKLVAVSKTYSTEILRQAQNAGALRFGENRVQEAETKVEELGRAPLEWHLIGNLQANKARKAVRLFDLIHTLDSLELAERLERICQEEQRPELSVLVQIDLAGEAAKSGVAETELNSLVEFLVDCRHLKLRGLMVLPPFVADTELTRPFFRKLRALRDDLQRQNVFGAAHGELSMGMSGDFETAIEEGATLVRVGTAIFGPRATSVK